jgi:DNA-binding MarR family transcriptional regulator
VPARPWRNPRTWLSDIVTITPAGRKQLRALDNVIDAVQERVLEPLTRTERRQLTKLLRKLTTTG